jgi:hypothetical protein
MEVLLTLIGIIIFISIVAGTMWLFEWIVQKLNINQGKAIVFLIIPVGLYIVIDILWIKLLPVPLSLTFIILLSFTSFCALLLWLIKFSAIRIGKKPTTIIFLFAIPFFCGVLVDIIFYDVLEWWEIIGYPFFGTIGIVLICVILTASTMPNVLKDILCVLRDITRDILKEKMS